MREGIAYTLRLGARMGVTKPKLLMDTLPRPESLNKNPTGHRRGMIPKGLSGSRCALRTGKPTTVANRNTLPSLSARPSLLAGTQREREAWTLFLQNGIAPRFNLDWRKKERSFLHIPASNPLIFFVAVTGVPL
jgi:hypothetical protein